MPQKYIYISFSFLLPIPSRAFRTAPLPLFYIHSPSLDSSVHLCSLFLSRAAVVHAQLRCEASGRGCLFVRFTLDRSYFLSRLSAATPSSVVSAARSLARSRSFLPPSHPAYASVSVSSVPFASFSNLRASVLYSGYAQRARRAGAQKHAARPC